MSVAAATSYAGRSDHIKLRVFIDYWNFQLTLNEQSGNPRFRIDWRSAPKALADAAAAEMNLSSHSYEGAFVFTSCDPKTGEGRKFRNWATNWLDRQPGIQVKCFERRPKGPQKCPSCQGLITNCPHCQGDLARTIEKGVDTAIVTDMIRLALEDVYQVGVLVSSDADLVPAVEFLELRGVRIIHAGFPPHGSFLSKACWATVDVGKLYHQFERS